MWVNNQVEPAYKKIIGGVCSNNRFHKSGDLILTLNMVKSYFSFTSYTDIAQIFQSMFSADMIHYVANKWPLENRSTLFGSLWNPSIFDGINKKKDKKEDTILLFDESLIQQLEKKPAGHPSYTRIKLSI